MYNGVDPYSGLTAVASSRLIYNKLCLKTDYTGFARLESSADAIHSAIVSPAVAMAAEVHCQRSPASAHCLSSSNRAVRQ